MSAGRLAVSFWNICLDNLPEGAFVRRRLTADDARILIEGARREKLLLCVSKDDLFAPFGEQPRVKHENLCAVLSQHFKIPFDIREFTAPCEHDGESYYTTNPLEFARVDGNTRLLVVTCGYTLLDSRGTNDLFRFEIDPASVCFDLFEVPHEQQVMLAGDFSEAGATNLEKSCPPVRAHAFNREVSP